MRMRLKSKRKIFIKKRIIIFTLLIIIGYLFYFSYSNISYYYLNYSIKTAKNIIDEAVDSSLTDDALSLIKEKDLYKITRNSSKEIEMIDYDSYLVNLFLRDVTNNISKTLTKGKVSRESSFKVPVGSLFKSPILNDKGPKIPVRMELIGSVTTNVDTKITDYGINNCLLEMYIHVEVKEKIMLPTVSDVIKVTNDIPISYKIIKGKVPSYYGSGITKSSNIFSNI